MLRIRFYFMCCDVTIYARISIPQLSTALVVLVSDTVGHTVLL